MNKIVTILTLLASFVASSRNRGIVIAESLELTLQRNVAFLRSTAGCSVPIDFDRALYQHLRYAFTQRNSLAAHIEINFDYYTINKRYHIVVMPDNRGVTAFFDRHKFQRNSLVPQSYTYEHVSTAVSRPIGDICRNSYDQSIQQAVFTSMVDAAVTGLLPYESIVGATVCFTRNVNPDLRTTAEDIFSLPNSRFLCCRAGEYFETCTKINRTLDDVVETKTINSVFLYLLYAIVYCYMLPLVIAWVLCDVNCLEDGRTLSYVVNPKTVYFGYAQLGFPKIIKKATFVLLGICGYALIAITFLTPRSPADQLGFIVCFLILSVILMFSAKRIVLADSLRPADKYVLGFLKIFGDSQQQKTVLSSTLGPKTDLLLQEQQDSIAEEHPDITVYPSISNCSRLLFMSKYWYRYCKTLRRICSQRRVLAILLPILAPLLLVAFAINTIPIVQLAVFAILQIRARLILHANGPSTLVLHILSIFLFVGYVALLLYIPCVLILCLYYTALSMLQSIHLLMIGLAFVIVLYQLGIFICQESEKFTYMTECIVRLNLIYLRYEGAAHRAPCCEQLVRSVPLNPDHVQINSIFFDSLVKTFLPLSHSLKTICFRAGLFLFVCSFLFIVLLQCGTQFFVSQTTSLNLLLAVLVPKLVFSLWPCCGSNSSLPSPSFEQAIYIFIDDWYRKNCQNSQKPSPAMLKIGPGIDLISKITTPTARDMVISNMMEQMPYSDNYYGTGKYSGNCSGGSPLTNYADTTMAESGRYTLTSNGPGHQGTLPSSIRHHHHNNQQQVNSTMTNSMIKHAVFATKPPHQLQTSSTNDTSSEVDSILYYNDIISKHPSERAYSTNGPGGRIYVKQLLDVKSSPLQNNNLTDLSDGSTSSDSPLAGPGSPGSYSNDGNVHISVTTCQQQRGCLATVRSQSETDESSL